MYEKFCLVCVELLSIIRAGLFSECMFMLNHHFLNFKFLHSQYLIIQTDLLIIIVVLSKAKPLQSQYCHMS